MHLLIGIRILYQQKYVHKHTKTKFKKIGPGSSGHELLILRVHFKQNTAAFWTL